MKNYYKILQVDSNADKEVIQFAYKALAQKWHPDKNKSSVDSLHMMKLLNEAKEVLTDPIKRAAYDRLIVDCNSEFDEDNIHNSKESNKHYETDNQSRENENSDMDDYNLKNSNYYSAEENNENIRTMYNKISFTSILKSLLKIAIPILIIVIIVTWVRDYNSSLESSLSADSSKSDYISFGLDVETVYKVMGDPTNIVFVNSASKYYEIYYDKSHITSIENKIVGWNNIDNNLIINDLHSKLEIPPPIGISLNDFISIYGNPNRVELNNNLTTVVCYFENVNLQFNKDNLENYVLFKIDEIELVKPITIQEVKTNEQDSVQGNHNEDYFSLNSTTEDVKRVMGNPTSIIKFDMINEENWSYNLASINFKDGIVNGYSNYNSILKVSIGEKSSNYYFELDSNKEAVIRAMGTPDSILKFDMIDEETWGYGLSSVTFKNGKVKEYYDYNGILRLK